jgi:hypothetical protein
MLHAHLGFVPFFLASASERSNSGVCDEVVCKFDRQKKKFGLLIGFFIFIFYLFFILFYFILSYLILFV